MRRHDDVIEDFMRVCENNRETAKAQVKRNILPCVLGLCVVITGICLVKRKRA